MKNMISNYSFNPATKQVTLNSIPNVNLENLLLITNVTTNVIIYSFADASKGGSILNNIVTLDFDTSTMNPTDSLQIYVDMPTPKTLEGESYPLDRTFTYDTNLESVLGTQSLIEEQRLKVNVKFEDKKISGVLGSHTQALGIECRGSCTTTIQVSGTWSASYLVVEGCVEDSPNYSVIAITNTLGASPAPWQLGTILSNGIYRASSVGMSRIRIRLQSPTSGAPMISLVASSTPHVTPLIATSGGYLTTYDTTLANMYRRGMADPQEQVTAPIINPTMPTSYADNKFARYAQIYQRLRVEIGGSERLPFAQEQNTNKMMVSNDDERRLLEEILIQMQQLNQNFAVANDLTCHSNK